MSRPRVIVAGKLFVQWGLGVLFGGAIGGSFMAVGLGLTLMALGQLLVYCAQLRLT